MLGNPQSLHSHHRSVNLSRNNVIGSNVTLDPRRGGFYYSTSRRRLTKYPRRGNLDSNSAAIGRHATRAAAAAGKVRRGRFGRWHAGNSRWTMTNESFAMKMTTNKRKRVLNQNGNWCICFFLRFQRWGHQSCWTKMEAEIEAKITPRPQNFAFEHRCGK